MIIMRVIICYLERSLTMQSQLSKVGIYDNVEGRQIMSEFFNQTFNYNASTILTSSERVTVQTLLAGPGGFLQVDSVWEGSKLITFIFIG